jgi:flagellar motor protein MotB
VAHLDSTPRLGRSQGAIIFWGLVSVCFAAAFCFYFAKNEENEKSAREFREEVLTLQGQRDSLTSQKDKLQAGIGETEKQLKTREDFLKEKETKLAEEESRLEALGQQSQSQTQQSQAQAAVIKKFNDTVKKLSKDDETDVVLRGGRPVLRVPSALFFAPGDTVLKPEGKALLNQIAQTLDGQLATFELRVECFTDNAEVQNSPDPGPKSGQKSDAATKPRYATTWELTAVRAAIISRFFREQTPLPFENVLVLGRSDFDPIIPADKEGHARNRRVEITVAPMPAAYHTPDLAKTASDKPAPARTPVNPLEPPPDPPASSKDKGN